MGAAFYVLAARWAASTLICLVRNGEVTLQDLQRLVWPASLAGGVIMTVALQPD
jgi:hypothetical protein